MQFNFSPYEHDVVVVGAKGQGKTTLVKLLLTLIPNIAIWIYDFNWLFTGFAPVVHRVEDLQYGQYVFQPKDKSYATFAKFCNKVFDELHNTVIIIDELHQYVTKQKACPELYQIVMSKRNDGVSGIYISTRTHAIPNWILTNVTHCFAFPLNLQSDIIWLKDYMGEKAWLLLPPDKRKILKEHPQLKQFSYLYRDMTKPDAEIVEP